MVGLIELVNSHSFSYFKRASSDCSRRLKLGSLTLNGDSDSCGLSLLHLFLSPDLTIFSPVTFPTLANFDHVISVSFSSRSF